MLQVQTIREEKEKVIAGLEKKHFADAADTVAKILTLDDDRKTAQREMDDTLAEANRLAKSIGELMKQGKKEEAEALKTQVAALKTTEKVAKEHKENIETALENILLAVPNVPHESVPQGKTPEENEVYQDWASTFPTLHEAAQPHWELMKKYDIVDLELGVKITGAGFPVYKGKGAKLQRALISFFLDEAEKAGYQEIMPPHMVNAASARGTGQLPDKDAQMYYVGLDEFYLIPTAEVPITNIYRDVLLDNDNFSIKMCGYTPCFRREAGSYGAHVRGLNRLHQFDKVEIVRIEHPEKSYAALQEMLAHVSSLMEKLELPYRILRLCGGDMSFASALTFDYEVWSAAQERWLEVSSVSNFETYQANRLQLRFKNAETKKTQLAHTLNGSAMALARIVAALLENHQTPEGVRIPKALQKYTGFELIN
jgi:seryl-tRNA synthetase